MSKIIIVDKIGVRYVGEVTIDKHKTHKKIDFNSRIKIHDEYVILWIEELNSYVRIEADRVVGNRYINYPWIVIVFDEIKVSPLEVYDLIYNRGEA